jgi:signal transduction histidine kinase
LDVGDQNVALEVEDHGVGIPKSEQEKIFERFYRIANGSGKGGYGLGLFMVRHIMQAHGGRAEVESEPGRGSRFRLVFPVVNEWTNNASS